MSQYAMDDDLYLFPVMCGDTKTTASHTWMCMADEHDDDHHYWVVT